MLTTKRAFILWCYQRGRHGHRTNGGFVFVGLTADCSHKVSVRQQRNNIWCCLHILLQQSRQTITTNSMELCKRIRVEIKLRLSSVSQLHSRRIARGRGMRLASTNFDNKNKSE
ncbi:hypothetical protein NP493_399g02038 [Ridgeia piscesae]|uniref:Uncharacterized protein n=1 Tax=Ridgeia piscesae TaxID=27915 RepID=A0AAD9NVM3_RIDPI|nr:hypothetical protein NP493_399g02038 [Ridgeia piscesae]